MAYTDIDKPDDYFNTVLYTGTSASNAITVGFQPDWVWIKWRDGANNHKLQDAIRGITKAISSNTTGAEVTDSPSITSFDTNGFTLGNDGGDYNYTGRTYASWNWLANGAGVSNTSGSITSTVSANTTSGFSIVSYTGTGTNADVGHGLGATPTFIIWKNRSTSSNWIVQTTQLDSYEYLVLNSTASKDNDYSLGAITSANSNTFNLQNNSSQNGNGNSIIAYCFAEKKGFSKFGSYTGNGSTDGTFVYTGFKPAFVLFKRTSSTSNWSLFDNKRNTFNITDSYVQADTTAAEQEYSDIYVDFLSNGIKQRGTNISLNSSGDSFIYMAFAENPFVTSTSVPTTAR
jgi:hypothetical protein